MKFGLRSMSVTSRFLLKSLRYLAAVAPPTPAPTTTFLVVGGLNLTYLLSLAWRSGQTEGVYQPSAALSRVGVAAIASLALWVAGYFAIGIAVVNG